MWYEFSWQCVCGQCCYMSCACIVSQLWRALSFNHIIIQEVENIRMEMSEKKKIENFQYLLRLFFTGSSAT